ncbi:reverse transcriptase domain, reverse transcriptase zinc-binding domain protein [Tanacetum coccineum]
MTDNGLCFEKNGAWKWPSTWFVAYPVLISMPIPILIDDQEDILQWRKYDGSFDSFSVREAWNTIREHANEVDWFHLVWSHHSIPRHAIHVWLIMRRRLKTHDRMRQWDVGPDIDLNLLRCSLCKAQPDSHDHLFFECPYSSRVWLQVLHMADIQFASSKWCDIMDWLLPISKQSNVLSIVGRLLVAAVSYYIWQERNNRIHGKGERHHDQLVKVIKEVTRLKLASIKFKKSVRVEKLRATWKIVNLLSDGG